MEETPSTKTLRMVAEDGASLPPFQASQYVHLFVEIDGVSTARPYAISSAPSQHQYYDLTVKRAQGGFVSNYLLDHVAAGQHLLSSGPMGIGRDAGDCASCPVTATRTSVTMN
ncbi:FAD-binding oxidoreductase [Janthinobacterium sp. TB1-E2]|uniref:FAD-binding oxidoreductase n=1 Tax=Janthinobacterium aestuarii TaxID=2985511 RepID=A0ABZ2GUA9_9BURK